MNKITINRYPFVYFWRVSLLEDTIVKKDKNNKIIKIINKNKSEFTPIEIKKKLYKTLFFITYNIFYIIVFLFALLSLIKNVELISTNIQTTIAMLSNNKHAIVAVLNIIILITFLITIISIKKYKNLVILLSALLIYSSILLFYDLKSGTTFLNHFMPLNVFYFTFFFLYIITEYFYEDYLIFKESNIYILDKNKKGYILYQKKELNNE